MMRRIAVFAVLLLMMGAGVLRSEVPGADTPAAHLATCGPRDALVDLRESYLRLLVADTSADYRTVRDSLSIPMGAASGVAYVTSDSVCTEALAALQRVGTGAQNMPAVGYVWRIGPTRFYVWHRIEGPPRRTSLASIFDETFATFYGRILE